MSNQMMQRNLSDKVQSRITEYVNQGMISFPKDYSYQNALKSAWLKILETEGRGNVPALEACKPETVANAMLSMTVQGLNVDKNQGYFIVYSNKLAFQRSYFGDMALAKRVNPKCHDITAEVVFEGDDFKFEIKDGLKIPGKHEQTLDSMDSGKIRAAYCVVKDESGKVVASEIMTFENIKKSWSQSKMKPVDDKGNVKAGTTHAKFPEEMCKKTVVRKTLKPLINESGDESLHIVKAIKQDEESIVEAEVEAEVVENVASEEFVDAKDVEFKEVEPVEDDGPFGGN